MPRWYIQQSARADDGERLYDMPNGDVLPQRGFGLSVVQRGDVPGPRRCSQLSRLSEGHVRLSLGADESVELHGLSPGNIQFPWIKLMRLM